MCELGVGHFEAAAILEVISHHGVAVVHLLKKWLGIINYQIFKIERPQMLVVHLSSLVSGHCLSLHMKNLFLIFGHKNKKVVTVAYEFVGDDGGRQQL